MNYFRYIILLLIILIYILFTVLSVEPFFEGVGPSYILLLREPNEKMLTEFFNIGKQMVSFDISNPTDRNIFIATYPQVITDIGGTSAFNNMFKRQVVGPPTCTAVAPGTTAISSRISASDYNTAYTGVMGMINTTGSTYFPSTGYTALDGTALTTLLTNSSTAYALNGIKTAAGNTLLYAPWSCSSPTCGITFQSKISLPTTLPTSVGASISSAVTSSITNYNNRIQPGGDSNVCSGNTYFLTPANRVTCADYQFDTTSLKTNVNTIVGNYIKEAPFQSINPGYSCMAPNQSGYQPTYLDKTKPYPVQAAPGTPQSNLYFNGIVLGSVKRGDTYVYSVIANEVGQEHVTAMRTLSIKIPNVNPPNMN